MLFDSWKSLLYFFKWNVIWVYLDCIVNTFKKSLLIVLPINGNLWFVFPITRCALSMEQISWSINAGTAARWLYSSALAPRTFAMPAMMTSRGWPVSLRRNCPIVLQVLDLMTNNARLFLVSVSSNVMIYFSSSLFWSQALKESSWKELSALCMWFTHQLGRSLLWAVGFVGMLTPFKQQQDISWKPVCLLWSLATAAFAEVQPWSLLPVALWHFCQVWTRVLLHTKSPQVCSATYYISNWAPTAMMHCGFLRNRVACRWEEKTIIDFEKEV